jgi:hypothetical protein
MRTDAATDVSVTTVTVDMHMLRIDGKQMRPDVFRQPPRDDEIDGPRWGT